jgi:hypothetical protein
MREHEERRGSARLVQALPFRIEYGEYELACRTVNVSATGLLCRVEQKIPTMSRVEVVLVLPPAARSARPGRNRVIRAQGVVVRSEPDSAQGEFQTAIFFTQMSRTSRGHLEAYVRRKLKQR